MLTPPIPFAAPLPHALAPSAARAQLVRRGRVLVLLTLAATTVEASVGVGAGLAAGSMALLGFGADSVIEVTAAAAAYWRLGRDADPASRAGAEHVTLRIVGVCFLLLAAYVAVGALDALWHHAVPDHSVAGAALALGSIVVMPLLSRAKRRVAAGLGSGALHAEAEQTALCAYLATILFGGLVLHRFAGWWWADPAAALVMVPIIAKDGVDSLRGRGCADCGTHGIESHATPRTTRGRAPHAHGPACRHEPHEPDAA